MKHIFTLLTILFGMVNLASAAALTPPCVPGLSGPVINVSPRIEFGTSGKHIYWWCKEPDGRVQEYGLSCQNSKCSAQIFGNAMASLAAMVKPDVKTVWESNVQYNCVDVLNEASERGAMCRERYAILKANEATWLAGYVKPAPPPPPVVWKVKVNGTATTRPAYTLIEGIRGDKEAGRAPVGAVCNITKPTLASGADLWASYSELPLVALCAKVP